MRPIRLEAWQEALVNQATDAALIRDDAAVAVKDRAVPLKDVHYTA